MTFVRSITRALPIRVPIAGKKRDRLFKALDTFFKSTARGDVLQTEHGALQLDASHEPQRLLSYLYHNMLAYYSHSELGLHIAQLGEPGAVFVDIGANLGMYALVARCHHFETIVVEPEPRHAAFLKQNTGVFGKVLDLALSDEETSMPLYYEAGNSGSTSLFSAASYAKGTSVPVRRFSDLVQAGELGDPQRIRLIKIDVEGFEAQVVRGMRGFLESGARPDIWCEVRGDASGRNGGSYRAVRDDLASFGYTMQRRRQGKNLSESEADYAKKAVFEALFSTSPPKAE